MADTASSPSTKHQLKRRLSKRQYEVTQLKKNEPAFTGTLLDEQKAGDYCCIVCQALLFESRAKVNSDSGWPTYNQPADPAAVVVRERLRLGTVRSEVMCAQCDAFLGHFEADSEQETGMRYSINSSSLQFVEK